MKTLIAKVLVSSFGVGFSPILPGTLGSLVGVFLYLPVSHSPFLHVAVVLILCGLGVLVSHTALKTTEERDPTWIVMDEIVGMMISLFCVPPRIPFLVIGFVLFRFFDSVKVWPLDRLEKMKGGWGIFLDDIGAGFYTNIVLQSLLKFAF